MMETITNNNPKVKNLNKPAYIIFVLTGIYFIVTKDFSQATIFWGLALVFDPFNPQIPFPKRPLYQKILLVLHLGITFALFGLIFSSK